MDINKNCSKLVDYHLGQDWEVPQRWQAEISEERNPALVVPRSGSLWLDSASTSLELISETGWIAGLDIQDVDLVSAAVTAPPQVTEVSVLGSVKAVPTIDEDQSLTMDNVILLWAT